MKRSNRKLWGGRFTHPTAHVVERFTHSLAVDERLTRADLLGSLAHARMLGKTKIIPLADSKRLVRVLEVLLREYDQGKLHLDPSSEDVHTAIQQKVEEKAGAAAQRLHTGRSRNDQVVTAFRLFCKEKITVLQAAILDFQKTILDEADSAKKLIMPGYTHLRHAQPVLVAHLLLSYLIMLERDQKRLQGTFQRLDELPLGSGALTGSTLPIDRAYVAKQLGFSRVSENSVDAVTSRDFVIEFLSALSILSVHLSRIAEDFLLWSTAEFGFLRFEEYLLTGSSMMPQKQNPDFLELVRGGSSRVIGSLSAILTLLKGLSSGYQRDLQLDKEILFEALDEVEGMLAVLRPGLKGLRWNQKALLTHLGEESLYATDLAEYLVMKGLPFSQAHRAVGQLLAYAQMKKATVVSLPLATLRRFSPLFDSRVYSLFDPEVSVRRKRSLGSTNPHRVNQAILRWKGRLEKVHSPLRKILKVGSHASL